MEIPIGGLKFEPLINRRYYNKKALDQKKCLIHGVYLITWLTEML
jgi:hypothetical protein